MDNPGFLHDDATKPKKPLTRANSVLTNKTWHLTQTTRQTLCRCNSVLVTKNCCLDQPPTKPPPLYTKWSDSFTRLYQCDGDFQKFTNETPAKSAISTIYEPQFLASEHRYSGWDKSKHIGGDAKKEWWPGGLRMQLVNRGVSSSQKMATMMLALVLTILATGNIIYIMQSVQPSQYIQNKSSWIDVVLITGEFRITNEQFRPSLANNTSEDFQNLGGLISQQLDNLFTMSPISEPYHSTSVTDFSPSLVVHLQMVLKTSDDITSSKVGMAFLRGLHHHQNQVWLGNFSVDIQSIGFVATNDAIAWSIWSDWGDCHFSPYVGYIHTRTRNCSLRSGQYLYSTLPCLLIPHSHGNIESAPCKPQEIISLHYTAIRDVNTTMEDDINGTTENIQVVIVTASFPNTSTEGDSNGTEILNYTEPGLVTTTEHGSRGAPAKPGNATKPCACGKDEVCVALVNELVPRCIRTIDSTDPTGCGGHCKLNVEICQRLKDNAYRCIDDSKCLEDEWQCGNQLCIPKEKRCDGHFNCYDHTDEFNCDCVGSEQFTCNDSQCIPNQRFCDGFPDCRDQSDEPFGCGGECKRHEWKCKNARCIAKAGLCDGVDDCGDKSDELDCHGTLKIH